MYITASYVWEFLAHVHSLTLSSLPPPFSLSLSLSLSVFLALSVFLSPFSIYQSLFLSLSDSLSLSTASCGMGGSEVGGPPHGFASFYCCGSGAAHIWSSCGLP